MASTKIDFGPHGGGVQSFKSTDSLKEYIHGETSKWIFSISQSSMSNDGNFQNEILKNWRNIYAPFESILKRPINEDDVNYIESYGKSNPIISIDSYIGNAFQIVLSNIGADGCFGALLIWSGKARFDTLHDPKGRAGASLFLALTLVDPTSQVQKLREKTDLMLNEYSNSARAFTEELNEDRETNNNKFKEKINEYQDMMTSNRITFEKQNAELSKKLIDAEAEIERLTAQFKEEIRLEAPAAYWKKKAIRHGELHRNLGFATASFAIAFALTTWFFGPVAASHANSLVSALVPDIPSLVKTLEGQKFVSTLRLASVGLTAILLSTLAIWTLRYLVRMMISENHLKSDAETREVMISTYLALIKESGTTEKEDRHIILSSIFTPPTDGLLKDDGLPIATQLGMLANRAGP